MHEHPRRPPGDCDAVEAVLTRQDIRTRRAYCLQRKRFVLGSIIDMPLTVHLQLSSLLIRHSTSERSVFCRHTAESGRKLISTHKHANICHNIQPRHPSHRKLPSSSSPVAAASQSGDVSSSADNASGASHPSSRVPQSEAQPSTSYPIPVIQPGDSSKPSTTGRSSAPVQEFPVVSEGRRSASWEYKQRADKRSLWGTFIKGVALLVLGAGTGLAQLQAFMGSAWRVLGELTYPKPGAIARLTIAVLLSSAALTLIVWGLDTGFAKLLLPPVAHKLSGIS
ncbi:hypothetical protein COCOBI_12-1310 [Coccomyxa sp. Obi]|nr:hypothetical protein COCOBI_12-1310 [Coccomyxa sp. Obi]